MRKLNFKKYLLLFLFICLSFFITDKLVKAETITNMQFSSFRTTASSYNITSNSSYYDTVNEVPVNMGIIATGFAFEWITNYTTSCTGQTVINGTMAIPNVNLDYYWYLENIKEIYYAPNISGVDGTPCTWSVNPNNMNISFSCQTIQPNSNFIIGGKFQYREGANFNTYFRIYRNMNITCDNSANAIIDNNNINTENIINNQNENTENIINNQNENTEKEIESQKVCTNKILTFRDIKTHERYLINDGSDVYSDNYGITDYLQVTSVSVSNLVGYSPSMCFYTNNKTLISCIRYNDLSPGNFNLPSNTYYVRFSIQDTDRPQFNVNVCDNGNQALNDSINDLNDNMNNDDVTGATDEASDFFSSFSTDTFGLTSIITAPLNLIQSLTSSTCTQLHLPLPYLDNKYIDLPCMTTIYQTHFGTFFTIYQTITYGIIAYWVIVRIFNQVKDFKNPEHDEIEVVDL